MPKIGVTNAEHYSWGHGCDGWHLVNTPGLSIIQERIPPGEGETRHRHRHARQFFFVLSGQARFELGDTTLELGPNDGVEVAPGTPHRILNPGSTELSFLVISQPHSHGDRESA